MKLRGFVYLGLAIFAMVIIYGITITLLINDDGNRGTFGDMFGAINALFSGLAFAGIIFTILMQKEELSLQKKELRNSIKELAGQREEMKLQRFENTFFALISSHHEIVSNLQISKYDKPIQGKQVFGYLVEELTSISDTNDQPPYVIFYSNRVNVLYGYFGSIVTIYSFVDNSVLDDNLKKMYTDFFWTQLTPGEMSLIIEHCDYDTKMQKILDKYDFFDRISNIITDPQLLDKFIVVNKKPPTY